jgi:IS1 family transposase
MQHLWAYTVVEVWSRLWTSTLVGRRTLQNTFHHFRDMKQRCRSSSSKVQIATDSFDYNADVIAQTFGPTCVHVQGKKRYRKGRVVHTQKKLLIGTEDDLLEAMSRSEDSKTINTSYVERLNLTIRRSIACLQRNTNAICRSERSLTEQLELLRCYYNFVRPHSSLKFGRVIRTPAQQAGLVPKRLTWRKIFTARILGRQDGCFQSRMRARAVGQAHQNCLE